MLEYLRKKCIITISCMIGLSGAATIAADAWVYADSEDYSKVILILSSAGLSIVLVTSALLIKACTHKKKETVVELSKESMKELVQLLKEEGLGVTTEKNVSKNVAQEETKGDTVITTSDETSKKLPDSTMSVFDKMTPRDGELERQSSADSGFGSETISDPPASKLNYCHHCGNKLVIHMV